MGAHFRKITSCKIQIDAHFAIFCTIFKLRSVKATKSLEKVNSLMSIYYLYSPSDPEGRMYIGSTVKSLDRRFQSGWTNTSGQCIMRFPDARIELIEYIGPCTNEELREIEQNWISIMDCVNTNKARIHPKQCKEERQQYQILYDAKGYTCGSCRKFLSNKRSIYKHRKESCKNKK